jgi:hypothetical protein
VALHFPELNVPIGFAVADKKEFLHQIPTIGDKDPGFQTESAKLDARIKGIGFILELDGNGSVFAHSKLGYRSG